MPDLFSRLREYSEDGGTGGIEGSKNLADLVAFLQELCGLSKHLQMNNRGLLLAKLANLGLFEVSLPLPPFPPHLTLLVC